MTLKLIGNQDFLMCIRLITIVAILFVNGCNRNESDPRLGPAPVVQVKEARDDTQVSPETKRKSFEAFERGYSAYKAKNLDEAIRECNTSIQLNPTSDAFDVRGLVWLAKGEHDKAIADFSEAIRLNPLASLAFFNRGNAWHDKKQFDKAISDFSEAIRLDPLYPQAYNNRGFIWAAKREHEKALSDYNEAIRLDPKDPTAYENRANLWHVKKEFVKAVADFEEVLRRDPKDWGTMKRLAWLLATAPEENARNGKRAVELSKMIIEHNKATSLLTELMAASLAESGNFEDAVVWQEKALLDLAARNNSYSQSRLELYRQKKAYRKN